VTSIQTDIEARLATVEPDVEVLLAEVAGGSTIRLYVDHPDGVSLELCERITRHLVEIRERYALEVSSPGVERPLTKPEHYTRFVGRTARIRTRAAVDGARNISGEIVGASERDVTVAFNDGVIAIPYDNITRSHLVEE
jgi:ribosome maturation factor RimP